MSQEASLEEWSEEYWRWLTLSALPLWATSGIDQQHGGFQELLGLDGIPVNAARRSRVQGRQSFVFALAGKLGWTGPWRDVAEEGLNWLNKHALRSDGLFATLLSPEGSVLVDTASTYDQAFGLLAAAALSEQGMGPGKTFALRLTGCIKALRAHDNGGFVEADGRFLSNPHMHLLEAMLAWMEIDTDPLWQETASIIVTMALDNFIDPDRRVLREEFDAYWAPAPDDAGQVVEPGHQFEWAWLLERWARTKGDAAAHAAALDLFSTGLRGIDGTRNAAIDRSDPDMKPLRTTARLWPQTEWLKAACLLGDGVQQVKAAASLWRYLETPVAGLWRDTMRDDGSFAQEPAPASSLYHIICAVASLRGH